MTGEIGFSFKNVKYYLSFSQANPRLQSWHWRTGMPHDYVVTKESTSRVFDCCIGCDLFWTFVFGLILSGIVGGWTSEGNIYGFLYVAASLLAALGIGAAITLPSESLWRRSTKT